MSEPEYTLTRFRNKLAVTFTRDGKRKRYSTGTSDPSAARRVAPSIFADVTRPKGRTVADLWKGYEADMKGRAVLATMVHTWKALEFRFGALSADQIERDHCREHTAARRAAGIKDGTIHTELGHLRMVLLWAVKGKLISVAPHIERPSKPPPRERHLTRQEARSLIDHATMPHVRLFIILALTTGARSAALLGLTWNRCDFERGKINLRDPDITRPHKGRAVVPMNRTARTALLELEKGALTPYVIEWAGERVGSVKKGISTATRFAGLSDVSPHVLRHTAAVHMVEDGVPMEEVAQYLGHRDVEVTRRIYARFSPAHLQEAAKSLEYDDLGSPIKKRTSSNGV